MMMSNLFQQLKMRKKLKSHLKRQHLHQVISFRRSTAEVATEEKVEAAPVETDKEEVKEEAPAEEKAAEPEAKANLFLN